MRRESGCRCFRNWQFVVSGWLLVVHLSSCATFNAHPVICTLISHIVHLSLVIAHYESALVVRLRNFRRGHDGLALRYGYPIVAGPDRVPHRRSAQACHDRRQRRSAAGRDLLRRAHADHHAHVWLRQHRCQYRVAHHVGGGGGRAVLLGFGDLLLLRRSGDGPLGARHPDDRRPDPGAAALRDQPAAVIQ